MLQLDLLTARDSTLLIGHEEFRRRLRRIERAAHFVADRRRRPRRCRQLVVYRIYLYYKTRSLIFFLSIIVYSDERNQFLTKLD